MACVAAASRFESYSAASAFGYVLNIISLTCGGTPAAGPVLPAGLLLAFCLHQSALGTLT